MHWVCRRALKRFACPVHHQYKYSSIPNAAVHHRCAMLYDPSRPLLIDTRSAAVEMPAALRGGVGFWGVANALNFRCDTRPCILLLRHTLHGTVYMTPARIVYCLTHQFSCSQAFMKFIKFNMKFIKKIFVKINCRLNETRKSHPCYPNSCILRLFPKSWSRPC